MVGGGRWARVYLSVMAGFAIPFRVVVVSSANASALVGLRAGVAGEIAVVPDVDALRQHGQVAAALVINAAPLHADTTCRLLELGASVLVEKPMALHTAQVERIFATATAFGRLVMPALTFRHCSYLANFAQIARDQCSERPVRLDLEWHDPVGEHRYGEDKSYDPGISIAQDVMPHVWTVLDATLSPPDATVELLSCRIERGGRAAHYAMLFGGVLCKVSLRRESTSRRRRLALGLASGEVVALDFTREPGTIHIGMRESCADPGWDRGLKPIQRQLQEFISELDRPAGASTWHRVAGASSALVEQCDALLKQEQIGLLRRSPLSAPLDDVAYAIGELLGPRLLAGRHVAPGDHGALRARVRDMLHAMRADSRAADWYSAMQLLDPSTF